MRDSNKGRGKGEKRIVWFVTFFLAHRQYYIHAGEKKWPRLELVF